MSTKRKTSVDYRKDLEELEKERRGLIARVDKRIMEMAKVHPEFVWNVNRNDDDPETRNFTFKKYEIEKPDRYSTWIGWRTLNQKLNLLTNIEKYSEKKQGIKELILL